MRLSKLALAVAAFGLSAAAQAAVFSYTGTLSSTNDVQRFGFSVPSVADDVVLRTWSWAGGVNAAGQSIPAGGFDPILSVYDAVSGNRVAYNDDGGCSLVPSNAGVCFDTYLELDGLAAGNYIVTVSMFSNFGPTNIITSSFENDNGPSFSDRTPFWAFDIRNVEAASCQGDCNGGGTGTVPLPGTLGLALLGGGLLGLRRRAR